MLNWSSPAFTAAETYWCQLRNPREQTEYQLMAWARGLTVQNGATGDGDWHIELTGSKTSAVTNCIVIEIPPDTLNPAYFQARQDFLATITNAGSHDRFSCWRRQPGAGSAAFGSSDGTIGISPTPRCDGEHSPTRKDASR
jgi:hypothetical protein